MVSAVQRGGVKRALWNLEVELEMCSKQGDRDTPGVALVGRVQLV